MTILKKHFIGVEGKYRQKDIQKKLNLFKKKSKPKF
jgi:hypothetical protein